MFKKSLFLLLFLFPLSGWSFFHFEPGIGYNRGHYQTNKLQGIGLTLKTGAEFQNFFLLADIGYHDLQLGSIPTSTELDAGLAIGGDFRSWRFWFTYLAMANLETESAGIKTTTSGDGVKLGISGQLSSKAYINLEVRFIDFNKQEADGTSSDVSQFLDAALLSVSWKLY